MRVNARAGRQARLLSRIFLQRFPSREPEHVPEEWIHFSRTCSNHFNEYAFSSPMATSPCAARRDHATDDQILPQSRRDGFLDVAGREMRTIALVGAGNGQDREHVDRAEALVDHRPVTEHAAGPHIGFQ